MGNQPVYRYPPRSHAASCRCDRCLPFRSRPLSSGAWIWVAIPVVAGIFWIALLPLRIWHTIGSDGHEHPDTATGIAYGVIAGVVLLLMVFASIRTPGRPRPPKGRLPVEATAPASVPPMSSTPPAPPICLHPNAVRVASAACPEVTLENWCPGCETSLGAAFRWSCCSAPPGNSPGAGHLYNCPRRKR